MDFGYWIIIVSILSFQGPSLFELGIAGFCRSRATFLAFSNWDFKVSIYILLLDSSSMVATFSLTVSCMSNSTYWLNYTSFSCRMVSIARIDATHRLPSFKRLISMSNSSSLSYPNTVSGEVFWFIDYCSLRFIVSFVDQFCVSILYN